MLKKSEVLKEGYLKGLKAASRIISKMINESLEAGFIQNWISNINEECSKCSEDEAYGDCPMVSIGDWNSDIDSMRYDEETDVLTVVLTSARVLTIEKASDVLAERTIDGAGFYIPCDRVKIGDEPACVHCNDGESCSVLFWGCE